MYSDLENRVARHYQMPGLLDAIAEGLREAGFDPEAPSIEALAPADEFHTAGRIATLKALSEAPIEPGSDVLDAGCGIGGTARHLAVEKQCRVTGIDLTPEYVEVARELTARMGLRDLCQFHEGSVLEMPFDDNSFDAIVSFHVAMNIADRSRFYRELARVAKTGATLCLFDVMKGPTEGMHYPVPWAETERESFLITLADTSGLVADAGFEIASTTNLREFAIGFFRDVFERAATRPGPPPLGLHLLTGANSREKFSNYARALEEHLIEPVILVAAKH